MLATKRRWGSRAPGRRSPYNARKRVAAISHSDAVRSVLHTLVLPDHVLDVRLFRPFDIRPIPSQLSNFCVIKTSAQGPLLFEAKLFVKGTFADPFESVASMEDRIDAVIADADLYESGEPRPSLEAVSKIKGLLRSVAYAGGQLPHPKISVYFGEIDLTWTIKNRLLRLIVFSDRDRPALLYFQTDKGEALTRGDSMDLADATDLSRKLTWLLG